MAQRKIQKHQRRRNKRRVFFSFIMLVILFVGGFYAAYHWFVGESKYINPTPSPKPLHTVSPSSTQIPSSAGGKSKSKSNSTSKPKSTSKASSTSAPKETASATSTPSASPKAKLNMKEYSNDNYGFSCPVMSDFSTYVGEDPNAVMSVRSTDGSAYEHIFVSDYAPSDASIGMRDFISSYPTAKIIKNNAGSGYFYALIKYEDMYIYRYAAYTDGTEKGFEFGYSESTEALYEDCPEEIKDNFDLY